MIEFITNNLLITSIFSYITLAFAITWLFGGMARHSDNRNLRTGKPND